MLEVERRVPTKIQLHQQIKIHYNIKINPPEQAARTRSMRQRSMSCNGRTWIA
jgi:hypothetical protein